MKKSDDIFALIQKEVDKLGHIPTKDELDRIVARVTDQVNNTSLSDAEGLSPNQLQELLYSLFSERSPVRLNDGIHDEMALKSPMTKLCQALMLEIEQAGELKLTNLVKVRNKKISLTAKGKKLLNTPGKLLTELFVAFCLKFNWGYFDGYSSENAAQFGVGYSLLLLHTYGKIQRKSDFYSKRVIEAIPLVLNEFYGSDFRTQEEEFASCYEIRLFHRGLDWFGLVEAKKASRKYMQTGYSDIKTTSLFYDFIQINL